MPDASASLRNRRQSVAAGSAPTSRPSPGSRRPAGPTKVGDALLQKRQSVSYGKESKAAFQAHINAQAPQVPLPSNPRPSGDSDLPQTQSQASETSLDINLLSADKFDAEAFVSERLAGSGTSAHLDDLRKLKDDLTGALQVTSTGLQKSVVQNYAEFVNIAKQVSTLENDLVDIKGALEEWRTVPNSLEISTGNSDDVGPSNRRAQRNSIADVNALYKAQLESLWDTVEGSQKFLPPVPNRHLITERSSFIQVDAATYKPRKPVHIFLLNDTMLVAVKKRIQMGAKERLVADRCFTLNEIVVVDMKDTRDLKNAIRVKRGRETMIYKTDKKDDKKEILLAFKKISEETLKKKQSENAIEAESNWGSVRLEGLPDDSGRLRSEPNPSPWVKPCRTLRLNRNDDPSGRDITWVDDLSSELAANIATREFAEAVSLIERGRSLLKELSSSPFSASLLTSTLQIHSSNLVNVLLNELNASWCTKQMLVGYASMLLRLDQGEAARESFLAGRGDVLKRRTSLITLDNDLKRYISELAQVYFAGIKNTCEWYMAAFKDPRMASGYVRWASEQMDLFTKTFRLHIWPHDGTGRSEAEQEQLAYECLDLTRIHARILKDVGLDFGFTLGQLGVPPSQDDQQEYQNGNGVPAGVAETS